MKKTLKSAVLATTLFALLGSTVGAAHAAVSNPVPQLTLNSESGEPAEIGSTIYSDVKLPLDATGNPNVTLSQTWPKGAGDVQNIISPSGWELEYLVDGVWTSEAPEDESKLGGVRTKGDFVTDGLNGDYQQITSSGTSTLAPAVSDIPPSGRGDGWDMFVTKKFLMNVYHHDGNFRMECHDRETGEVCDEAGPYFDGRYRTSNVSGGHVYGEKVFSYVVEKASGKSGVLCVDVTAYPFVDCGFTALGTSTYGNAQFGLSSQTNVGSKVYAVDFYDQTLYCFNMATEVACDEISLTGIGRANSWSPGFIQNYDNKIFITANKLFCVDSTDGSTCAGWAGGVGDFTSIGGDGDAMNIVPFYNKTSNTETGVCVLLSNPRCWAWDASPLTLPTGLAAILADASTKVAGGAGYLETNAFFGSKVIWPSNPSGGNWSEGRATCYDWETDALCAGFNRNTFLGYSIYAFRYYPQDDPNCFWVNGDLGYIYGVNATTGRVGCATSKAVGQLDYQVLAPLMSCNSDSGRIRTLNTLTLTAPAGVDVTDLRVTLFDGNDNIVEGFDGISPDANGVIDLSSIEVTTDLQEFRFTMESVDLTLNQATSIQGELDYTADPVQLCVELVLKQVCPFYNPGTDYFSSNPFAVEAGASVTYGATTVTGSANDSFDVADGYAGDCEFISLPPEIDLALDLEIGQEVSNADVLIQGGNLMPNTEYVLTMHSTPVELYRGLTDEMGSFANTIQIPTTCPAAGRHKLVLTGYDLDNNPITRTTYFAVDSNCTLLAKGEEQIRKIRSKAILFEADKAVMTKEGLRTLKALYWSIRGADSIKVEGYTNPTNDTMKSKWTAMKLAKKRANVIVGWLKARGVNASVKIKKAIGPRDLENRGPAINRRAIVVARWLPEIR